MHVFYGGAVVRTSPARTTLREAVSGVKGGVPLFRGSGAAARLYVVADRSQADEYYLGADDAVAEYSVIDSAGEVTTARSLSADESEGWVDWVNPDTGESMGTPRKPGEVRKGSPLFAEMTFNAPKSLSVAAALHPEVSEALGRGAAGRGAGDSTVPRPAFRHAGGAARSAGSPAHRADADRRHHAQDLACG